MAYLSRAMMRASSFAGLVMTISKLLRETFVPCMPPGGESYSKLKNMARQGSSCESGAAGRTGTDRANGKRKQGASIERRTTDYLGTDRNCAAASGAELPLEPRWGIGEE